MGPETTTGRASGLSVNDILSLEVPGNDSFRKIEITDERLENYQLILVTRMNPGQAPQKDIAIQSSNGEIFRIQYQKESEWKARGITIGVVPVPNDKTQNEIEYWYIDPEGKVQGREAIIFGYNSNSEPKKRNKKVDRDKMSLGREVNIFEKIIYRYEEKNYRKKLRKRREELARLGFFNKEILTSVIDPINFDETVKNMTGFLNRLLLYGPDDNKRMDTHNLIVFSSNKSPL